MLNSQTQACVGREGDHNGIDAHFFSDLIIHCSYGGIIPILNGKVSGANLCAVTRSAQTESIVTDFGEKQKKSKV